MIKTSGLLRETKGTAVVEFALIITVLLLLIMGTLEFGLAWYTKYAIASAAREGARYGTIYRTRDDGSRLPPCQLIPSIQTVVNNYLANLLPAGSYNVQIPDGSAYQTGGAGQDLTVIVSCTNPWNLLGGFIPALQNKTFHSQSVMKCE